MHDRFEAKGVWITDVFYCPFHPEHGVGDFKKESFDRKTNPGMLLHAAEKHSLDLGRSIMIGDKDSDMQAATKAGVGVRCQYLAGARRYHVQRRGAQDSFTASGGLLAKTVFTQAGEHD